MLRNNDNVRRCSYFELGLPVVEPRYNEEPRDWQDLFFINVSLYRGPFVTYFTIRKVKKDRTLKRGLRYIEAR